MLYEMSGNSGSLKTPNERYMGGVNVTGRFDTTITFINYDNYTSTCVQSRPVHSYLPSGNVFHVILAPFRWRRMVLSMC